MNNKIINESIITLKQKQATLLPLKSIEALIEIGVYNFFSGSYSGIKSLESIYTFKSIAEVANSAYSFYHKDYYKSAEKLVKAGIHFTFSYASSEIILTHPSLIAGGIIAETIYDSYQLYTAYDKTIDKLEIMADNNIVYDFV